MSFMVLLILNISYCAGFKRIDSIVASIVSEVAK